MKIAVIGLGVIGGSYVKSLKGLNHEVYGVDCDVLTLNQAKEEGFIKEGFVDSKDIVDQVDLTIICLYPEDVLNFIKENTFKKGSIVTDATGIKRYFLDQALQIMEPDVEFLSGHPMAGREKKGFKYASADVFKGANYILIKHDLNTERSLEKMEQLIRQLGFKKISILDACQHDKIISFTSQLPHVLAVALINSDLQLFDTGKFIGDSYRDLTRIANINEILWSELFLNNKEYLLESIEEFEQQIILFKNALQYNDVNKLQEMFIKSSKRRQALEK